MSQRRSCRVCYQKVSPTLHGMVEAHWDTAGNVCEGEGLPYELTVALRRRAERFVA